MQKLKFRLVWALFSLVTLSGCEPVEGIGKGLANIFRSISISFPKFNF
jgi:hypothetical protein